MAYITTPGEANNRIEDGRHSNSQPPGQTALRAIGRSSPDVSQIAFDVYKNQQTLNFESVTTYRSLYARNGIQHFNHVQRAIVDVKVSILGGAKTRLVQANQYTVELGPKPTTEIERFSRDRHVNIARLEDYVNYLKTGADKAKDYFDWSLNREQTRELAKLGSKQEESKTSELINERDGEVERLGAELGAVKLATTTEIEDLKQKLVHNTVASNRFDELTMENEQLASTLRAEQAKVARLNNCVKYLQDGAKVTQAEVDNLAKARTVGLERKGEELKTSINERDTEIERLKTKLEAVTTEAEDLKQKLVNNAVESTRFNELTMENGQLASTLSAEQAKVARLNDCVKYLQDGAKVTQTELDTLTRERTAELERKGEELKTSINERDNEIERLKTEAEAVTTEVENIKQKSVDEAVASTRFNELTTENERLSSLLIAEQAKVTRLNDCVKYLQDGAKAAQTEIDNVNRERTAELEAMKLAMTAEVEDLKRNLVDNTMASNGFNELTTENERLASALSAEQANVARLNDCIKYLQHGARVMQTDVNNLTKEQSAELERKGEELRTSIHEKDSEIERLKAELEGVKLAMVVEVENLQRTRDELEILQQANAPSPDVVELSLALVSEQTKTAALEIEKSRAVALSNSFVIGLSELKEMLNSRDEEITELRKARDAKIAENDRLCAERDAFEGTGPRRVNEIVDLLAELRAQEVIQLHQRERIRNLTKSVEDQKAEIGGLQAQALSLQNNIDNLTKSVEGQKTEIDALQVQRGSLRNELDHSQTRRTALRAENERLHREIRSMEGTLEQQRVDMKAAAAADKRKIKELEVQGGSLRNELHHSQTRCTSMKAAHDSLHAEVRSLEGTVQQQRVDMKAAAAAAKQKIKELEVQGRSLRKELDHFETLCITLELENKRLHVDNNKLAGTVQQQRTEIKADKRKIEELGARIGVLQLQSWFVPTRKVDQPSLEVSQVSNQQQPPVSAHKHKRKTAQPNYGH